MRTQCELLSISRSSIYYEVLSRMNLILKLMRLLDEQYTKTPFYGVKRMTAIKGVQFTTPRFKKPLLENDIKASMDVRDRALDNIFVERLWSQ